MVSSLWALRSRLAFPFGKLFQACFYFSLIPVGQRGVNTLRRSAPWQRCYRFMDPSAPLRTCLIIETVKDLTIRCSQPFSGVMFPKSILASVIQPAAVCASQSGG